MAIARLIPNICARNLAASRDFYVTLLGFQVAFDSDWYVQVTAPGTPRLELGLIQHDHDLVPPAFRGLPRGQLLTIVVADVDAVYAKAQAMNLPIIQPPRDEFYGQRRLLLSDPDGLLLDISTPIRS